VRGEKKIGSIPAFLNSFIPLPALIIIIIIIFFFFIKVQFIVLNVRINKSYTLLFIIIIITV